MSIREPVYYVVFHNKTAFIPLKYIYPECYVLRQHHPQVDPLQCLETSCPADKNCMGILVKRVNYIFENVLDEKVEMIVSYFKLHNDRIRAGIFDRALEDPRVMTCNKSALQKFQKEGKTFMWVPRDEYYMITPEDILIKPEDLVRLQ